MTALWLALGCAKPPHDELQAAETKVREAQSVGASVYLPDEFNVLVAKLETAKGEIEAQYKTSEFSRDYSRANSLLNETRAEADRIIPEAQKRRDEAKAAALKETEQAKQALHVARELVERAEQTKPNSPKEAPGLMSEADELNRTLVEVQTAIEANNHLVAKDKAKAVQEKSQKLQSEVKGARRAE